MWLGACGLRQRNSLFLNEISVTASLHCDLKQFKSSTEDRAQHHTHSCYRQAEHWRTNTHLERVSWFPLFCIMRPNEHGPHEAGRGLRCTGDSSRFRNDCSFEHALPCCLGFEDRSENECRSVSQLLEFLLLTSYGNVHTLQGFTLHNFPVENCKTCLAH